IEKVAEMSGWNGGAPAGRARGIAYYLSFGVPVAEIVEVEMAGGRVRITNIWAAADVGIALDPDNVRAQVQSGIIYGLSAAISGEITIEDGKVVQSNFHDYDVMRMYQAPPIEVAVLEHGAKIRGIGEPGLPPAAPALANAIFAATGKRIRSLPLNKSIDFI
ncbi:MAG: molybdopterin cofactor-binding domain-containing protein, partial [Pseudomonadota bacterium]